MADELVGKINMHCWGAATLEQITVWLIKRQKKAKPTVLSDKKGEKERKDAQEKVKSSTGDKFGRPRPGDIKPSTGSPALTGLTCLRVYSRGPAPTRYHVQYHCPAKRVDT